MCIGLCEISHRLLLDVLNMLATYAHVTVDVVVYVSELGDDCVCGCLEEAW